jgi:FkbM family methyltransferase
VVSRQHRVVADVGANVGRLSELFWRQGAASVVSIEPQAENVARIEARIAALGAENWRVEACAVSAVAGTLRMRAFDVPYGKNSVALTAGSAVEGDVRDVPAARLEDLVPEAQVVKVDIEGHEYAVLPTAVPALARVEVWALELHMMPGHPLEETLGLFADHGYALFAAGRKKGDPDGAWLSAPIPPTLGWKHIPGTSATVDGIPGVFKMLHVLAKR